MLLPLISILSLAALLSLGATIVGWRGKPIDDHPLCRRCGFDLTGKPDTSTRCPECGADLSHSHSIRIGHRQRRTRWLASGFTLFIPSILLLATIIFIQISGADITKYKPVWLLRRDLDSGASAQSAALTEFSRRVSAGELKAEQAVPIADRAMLIVSSSTAWQPAADFLEAARGAKFLDGPRWAAYGKLSMLPSLKARPIVRQGDPVPITISQGAPRLNKSSFVALFDWSDLRIDDSPAGKLPDQRLANFGTHDGKLEIRANGYGASYYNPTLDGSATRGLAVGHHTVSVKLQLHLYDAKDLPNYQLGNAPPPDVSKELASYDVPMSAQFDICDAEHAPPLVTSDESLNSAVESAIKIQMLKLIAKDTLSIDVDFKSPPVRLAFDVSVRAAGVGNEETKINMAEHCSPNSNEGYISTEHVVLNGAAKVDFIFRPSVKQVGEDVDMTPIWGKEIILHDVPVALPPVKVDAPATRR